MNHFGPSDIMNSILPFMLYAGTLPNIEFEKGHNLVYKYSFEANKIDELIAEGEIIIRPTYYRQLFFLFIIGILDGYQYQDPFYQNYGQAFFYFLPAIVKTITINLNPSIQNIEEFEKEFELPFFAHFLIALGIDKEEAISKKDKILEIAAEKILNPITQLLPIDKEEIIIASNKLARIKPDAVKRIKEYLEKNPDLELPQLIIDILADNNIKAQRKTA